MLLERAHRFCVKYMHGLSIRTHTDVSLSLLSLNQKSISESLLYLDNFAEISATVGYMTASTDA